MKIKINGKTVNNGCKRSEEYIRGAMDLAELVGDLYNGSTNHPYHIGDCALFKMCILDKRQLRKNFLAKCLCSKNERRVLDTYIAKIFKVKK